MEGTWIVNTVGDCRSNDALRRYDGDKAFPVKTHVEEKWTLHCAVDRNRVLAYGSFASFIAGSKADAPSCELLRLTKPWSLAFAPTSPLRYRSVTRRKSQCGIPRHIQCPEDEKHLVIWLQCPRSASRRVL